MPIDKRRKVRKCKYCNNEAKRAIMKDGRNKGIYRTCGSEKCMTEQYRDVAVSKSKIMKKKHPCKECGSIFIKRTNTHKWCNKCAPNNVEATILRRYGLTDSKRKELFAKNKGMCHMCGIKKAQAIDHNHKTSVIRGALCNRCNLGLSYIEDKLFYENAIKYLNT